MTYPALPLCAPQRDGETRPEYAARVLRFLLSTSTTATLTDEQLELADTAAQRATSQVRALDGTYSRLDTSDLHTVDILSAARHTIAGILSYRRDAARQEATGATITHPTGGKQPGRPAPLSAPPSSLPPTGQAQPLTPQPAYSYARKTPTDGINF